MEHRTEHPNHLSIVMCLRQSRISCPLPFYSLKVLITVCVSLLAFIISFSLTGLYNGDYEKNRIFDSDAGINI